MGRTIMFSACVMAMLVVMTAQASIINVPADQATIQAAIIAAAQGDTVLVAEGRYPENINFRGKNIVVASHYMMDDDPAHIMGTIIDGSQPAHADTASCVLIVSGEDSTAVLEGFTLTGGTGTIWTDIHYNADYREGGGILIELSSPTIKNNLIVDNVAIDATGVTSAGGGGIRCGDGNPHILRNVIASNRGRYGAGIVMNFATGVIGNNVICNNTGGEDFGGSGIWTYEAGTTIIEHNTITGNVSALLGGGIRVWATSIQARNNIIWGNLAPDGPQIGTQAGVVDLTYSAVQGGFSGDGNIDAHPKFQSQNVYLADDSPCIDAGDPGSADDPEDPSDPGQALFPAMGGLRNDMGAYGGASWAVWDEFTTPVISLSTTELVFEYVSPGLSDTTELVVENRGCGLLTVERIEQAPGPDYVLFVAEDLPLTVDPFENLALYVVWTNVEDVPLCDTLLVYHDDEDSPNPLRLAVSTFQFSRITEGDPVNDGTDSRSVNWVDYDQDGHLDLFVSNGLTGGQDNLLYHGDGDGGFTQVVGDVLVSDGGSSDGSSWGDYDNDGDLDVFVVNWYGQDNFFYTNNGDGTFAKITDGDLVNHGGHSETCAWGDYDNDGHLDLFVSNSGDAGAEANFLYHNEGDGTFRTVTEGDVVIDETLSRGAIWGDYDNDGDIDLFVANEANQNNSLYQNNGDGTFTKVTDDDVASNRGKSMGGSWGDYDSDGYLDLFVANSEDQNNFLYHNNGDGTFERIRNGPVVNDNGWSIGSAWGDYDNDGDLDLFVANGWGDPQVNFLYENNGDGTFVRVTEGVIAVDEGWAFGAAWGDYDEDGDLDLFVAKWIGNGEDNALYRNNGNLNHWITVVCQGQHSNASAIGARVSVKVSPGGDAVWQMCEISGQTGYCGQNSLSAHFGLGQATMIDSLVIHWPSGIVQVEIDLAVDQVVTIEETGVGTDGNDPRHMMPTTLSLSQNYPNPFSSWTLVQYELPLESTVCLNIYDISGKLVKRLVSCEQLGAGAYSVRWDGTNIGHKAVADGIYFCRLSADSSHRTLKMILAR